MATNISGFSVGNLFMSPSGHHNFEIPSRFIENVSTPKYRIKYIAIDRYSYKLAVKQYAAMVVK